jgi:hypothetical protein
VSVERDQQVLYSPSSTTGVANPRPALNIFPAREIHHTFTKYIYFIMAKVVKTNVLKNTLFVHPYIQKLSVEIMRKNIYNFICGPRSYDAFPKWPERSFGLATPDL